MSLHTKQVRQGALVLHIEPDGKVTYEVCLAIPKDFFFSSLFLSNSVVSINKRRFIRKWGLTWGDAMRLKLHAQVQIDEWKARQALNRKNWRQEKLFEFLAK